MVPLLARRANEPSDVVVDDRGIGARARREAILDVLVDGRRIFSFWLHRDGVHDQDGRWWVPWPRSLQEFLNGSATFSLVVHGSGRELFRDEVTLGDGRGSIEIVNADGQPLSLDKSLRRVQTFDVRSSDHLKPLLSAIEEVLGALREVGISGFLAYGTLLGAVRNGRLIGHDSDADLGYVSRYDHPVDVIRESFAIQRALVALGYRITRYSGLAFKVDVIESDGSVRGLDVFGGFMMDGRLHLMGEIRVPFEREWIYPLGTVDLEGVAFPAPADTDRFLTASYGKSWRVPDPAFHFTTPRTTHRRFNGWFRGLRAGRARWDALHSRPHQGPASPSEFVRWVAAREPGLRSFVDVGCGRGADVVWMGEQGVDSVGLDFQPRAFRAAAAGAVDSDTVRFWSFNLLELRHTLVIPAMVARLPAPRVVMARHLVDTLGPRARARLWRSARMMLAGGDGRLYLEFLARKGDDGYASLHKVRRRKVTVMLAELEAEGATVVHRDVRKVSAGKRSSRVARIVVEWKV
jgi:hypothetical protein